ncbi:hypothetical protein KY334_05690 [Candidatus Woesearchaeota archaeon]|nr:hypothetical protein [Candidatus Woesearchaeota archaeon]
MIKNNTIVAPVGDYLNDLYVGIREFSTKKVILLTPKGKEEEANSMKKDLEKFRIETKITILDGHIWEEVFKEIANAKKYENNVLINVSTGDRDTRCAATSAAFVNGLKAFAVDNNEVFMLPVLKFSYYSLLPKKKLDMLKLLYNEEDCCGSLENLSKKLSMSLPLISYHINGTLKSEGLKEMGLIETNDNKGKTQIRLTTLGKMMVKGYIN